MEDTMAALGEKEGPGWTSLHAAAKMPDGENTMALVLIINTDVNARQWSGLTPLHIAAYFGHKEAASLLLSAGARIDATDKEGLTPLHCASVSGHKQMAAFLIDNGADVDSSASGVTPLMLAYKHPEVCALLRERGARTAPENNLARWKASGEPGKWVRQHDLKWGHQDWLDLLASLRRSEFWPMDEASIGAALEATRGAIGGKGRETGWLA